MATHKEKKLVSRGRCQRGIQLEQLENRLMLSAQPVIELDINDVDLEWGDAVDLDISYNSWQGWDKLSSAVFTGQYSVASDPAVIKDGDIYRMFNTGLDVYNIRTIITEAISSDGINWNYVHNNSPFHGMVLQGRDGEFDENLEGSFVLKRGGEYWLYYSGYEDVGNPIKGFPAKFALAKSTDGINFTRYSDDPILEPTPNWYDNDAIYCPTIIEYQGQYVMMYCGHNYTGNNYSTMGNHVLAATSTDGIHWTKRSEPVLTYGDGPSWMSGSAAEPSLVAGPDGKFYLFFTGLEGEERVLGVAKSDSPFGPWDINPNPIITPSASGFDSHQVLAPEVIVDDGELRMWYLGVNPQAAMVTGYAEPESVDLTIVLSTDSTYDGNDIVLSNTSLTGSQAFFDMAADVSVTLPGQGVVPNGDYYVLVISDQGQASSMISIASAVPPADLQVSDVDLDTGGASAKWGQSYQFDFQVQNTGQTGSGAFNATIVISSNANFDAWDTTLRTISLASLASGASSNQSTTITMPAEGTFADGQYYIIVKVDSGNVVMESNENNNTSALLESVDTLPNVAPTISALQVNPTTVYQPEYVTISALGVNDSDGSVNRVEFYRDSNGNGTLEVGSDTLLGVDVSSSSGWSWTDTSGNLPVGTNLYFARARDNDSDWSNTISGSGVVAPPNNPPTIGSIEGNESSVNQGDSVTLSAINVNDDEGAVAKVKFYLDSNKNNTYEAGSDLPLGSDADGSDGWNWTGSSAGWDVGTARFFALAQDDIGQWSNMVTTTVEVLASQTNSAPSVGSLSGPVGPVTLGDEISLVANQVQDSDGSVTAVEFYLDANNNGTLETGLDTLLSSDTSGAGGWSWSGTNGAISAGANTFFARARDNQGAWSNTASVNVEVVLPNESPVVDGLVVNPGTITIGQDYTLTAENPMDADGSISRVEFYLDANNNGTLEAGLDTLLGSDTSSAGGWSWSGASDGLAVGTNRYFVRVQDNQGQWSAAATATATVESADTLPTIGSVTVNPVEVEQGDDINLIANGVNDTVGNVAAVKFYADTDGNGSLDAALDTLLGSDTNGGDGWSWSGGTEEFSVGEVKVFAQAVDDTGNLSNVAAATATINEVEVVTEPDIDLVDTNSQPLSVLDFDEIPVRGSRQIVFAVRNNGSAPLNINSIVISGRDFDAFELISSEVMNSQAMNSQAMNSSTVSYVISPGAQQDISLLFSPEQRGLHEAIMTLTSNDPDEGDLSIALAGTAVQPVLVVDVTPNDGEVANPEIPLIDFGVLTTDGTGTAQAGYAINLVNQGTADLTISSVALASGEFFSIAGVTAEGLTLAAGQSVSAAILFSSAELGDYSDTLIINSNDPDNPVMELDLISQLYLALDTVDISDGDFYSFTDADGDEIELQLGRGTSAEITFAGDIQSGYHIDTINLDAIRGGSVVVAVSSDAGDGAVQIGEVIITGGSFNTIEIDGSVGSLVSDGRIRTIEISGSLGGLSVAGMVSTFSSGGLSGEVTSGGFRTVVINGDLENAEIDIEGERVDLLNSLVVNGAISNSTINSGLIQLIQAEAVSDTIINLSGSRAILGTLDVAGDVQNLTVNAAMVGNVNVDGDLVDGVFNLDGDRAGFGSLDVVGDAEVDLEVAGVLRSVNVGGSLEGNLVAGGESGQMSTISVGENLSADLSAYRAIRSVNVGGDIDSSSVSVSGSGRGSLIMLSAGGDINIANLDVDGMIRTINAGNEASPGNLSGNINADSAIMLLNVTGDLDGQITAGSRVSTVNVAGDITAEARVSCVYGNIDRLLVGDRVFGQLTANEGEGSIRQIQCRHNSFTDFETGINDAVENHLIANLDRTRWILV